MRTFKDCLTVRIFVALHCGLENQYA